jgi:hypothetical protein
MDHRKKIGGDLKLEMQTLPFRVREEALSMTSRNGPFSFRD